MKFVKAVLAATLSAYLAKAACSASVETSVSSFDANKFSGNWFM